MQCATSPDTVFSLSLKSLNNTCISFGGWGKPWGRRSFLSKSCIDFNHVTVLRVTTPCNVATSFTEALRVSRTSTMPDAATARRGTLVLNERGDLGRLARLEAVSFAGDFVTVSADAFPPYPYPILPHSHQHQW